MNSQKKMGGEVISILIESLFDKYYINVINGYFNINYFLKNYYELPLKIYLIFYILTYNIY